MKDEEGRKLPSDSFNMRMGTRPCPFAVRNNPTNSVRNTRQSLTSDFLCYSSSLQRIICWKSSMQPFLWNTVLNRPKPSIQTTNKWLMFRQNEHEMSLISREMSKNNQGQLKMLSAQNWMIQLDFVTKWGLIVTIKNELKSHKTWSTAHFFFGNCISFIV
jgi:hypothetical protein